MLELKDGFMLYHGSYCEVRKPNLNKCAKRKDFGQGYGYISVFKFKSSRELKIHIFENANIEWLHCIAAHRKKKEFTEIEHDMEKFDVIAGKIADDATNATLTAYLGEAFGPVGNKEADEFCIKQLLPNKLKDQYCFKTEEALECLEFVRSEKIWLK